jgi:hypothetical protein
MISAGALAGAVALSSSPAFAQTCPPPLPLSAMPRGFVVDRWTPAASQLPVFFVVPQPGGGFTLFAPVHATLVPPGTLGPDGTPVADFRILLFGKAGDLVKAAWFTPTPASQPVPPVVFLTPESIPHLPTVVYDDAEGNHWFESDTLFCSGHSFTADGDLFIAGGTELYSIANPDRTATLDVLWGLEYATRYSPFSSGAQWSRVDATFSPGGSNLPRRWYSAVTRLADTRMLVTSGLDFVTANLRTATSHHHLANGTPNRSVEVWDPAGGSWDVLSTHGVTPAEVWNPDYTHVFPVPHPAAGNAVLMFGAAGIPVYLLPDAPEGSRWISQTTMVRPGAVATDARNHGTSSTLLPLRVLDGEWGYGNGSVVQAGGGRGSDSERRIDVYEFCSKSWAPSSLETGITRRHPATVLLPDGKVLVVSGHDDAFPATAQPEGVRHAQYLNLRPPASLTTGIASGGPAGEARGYHNVALLLPDGRVFVAGGRSRSENAPPDAEDEKPTFRYLHPPYMASPRPTITAAPATIGYGASFGVGFSGGPISEVVLIGLGTMTHAFDANQRHVQLALAAPPGATSAVVMGPPDRQTAPPGHYMLFVLDGARVPSVARIVHLQ